ncbi:MAG: MarR family transcriptional regulator [Candidatus Pacebacteria bacterium]|nr:MarR family transcriptional regulator [Candidatus Paceibacterota bacterium]
MIKQETRGNSELQDVFIAFHQKLIIAFRRKMEAMHFTFSQIETLRFIFEKKNPTMKNIADYLSISAPSATSMIESLANKKLITRKVDSKDRRTVRIVITPKASKLFTLFRGIKTKMFAEMLKNLNDNDKKQLTAILKKLV